MKYCCRSSHFILHFAIAVLKLLFTNVCDDNSCTVYTLFYLQNVLTSVFQVFSDVFVEDPLFICEIAQTLVMNLETQSSRSSQKEKQVSVLRTVGRLMNVSLHYMDELIY